MKISLHSDQATQFFASRKNQEREERRWKVMNLIIEFKPVSHIYITSSYTRLFSHFIDISSSSLIIIVVLKKFIGKSEFHEVKNLLLHVKTAILKWSFPAGNNNNDYRTINLLSLLQFFRSVFGFPPRSPLNLFSRICVMSECDDQKRYSWQHI